MGTEGTRGAGDPFEDTLFETLPTGAAAAPGTPLPPVDAGGTLPVAEVPLGTVALPGATWPARAGPRDTAPLPISPEQTLLERGAELGHYRLDRKLGKGAQGEVWLALDTLVDRPVALKLLPARMAADPSAMGQIRLEAKVLLDLTHEGIVRLHTLESVGGFAFLAMEYLGGPSLADFLETRRRTATPELSVAECLWLLNELAPALDYANSKGITHRDIKPANLMLTADPGTFLGDGSGVHAKLCDFGIQPWGRPALTPVDLTRRPLSVAFSWIRTREPLAPPRAHARAEQSTDSTLRHLDPQAYHEDVLARTLTTPASRIAELTPWGWAKARADEAAPPTS